MYLNIIQVAESFGVSEHEVESWIQHENLPCTPDRGRLIFDRAQVAQWAASRGLAAKVGFLAKESSLFSNGFHLAPLLRTGGIWRDLKASDALQVFEQVIAKLPGATPPVRQLIKQRLSLPGGITWAPVGKGFALPHPSVRIALGRESGAIALLILDDALPLTEPPPDGIQVNRLLFFIAPSPRMHLALLGRLSRALSHGPARQQILAAADDELIFNALAESDSDTPEASKVADSQ
jgi:PTS system nitrogen regulatory IIA component